MLNEGIVIQRSLLPFRKDFETLHLEKCKTVQEIVNKTIPFNFADSKLAVTLNNQIINCDDWNKPLKKGDIVGLNFIPAGSKSGGKNPFATILTLVAVFTVAYFAGPAIGAIGGTLGVSEGVAAGIYYVGSSMVLTLTQTALASTPKQQSYGGSSIKESTTQFIEGARNVVDKYGVIPINLGVNRMFPKQAALPYTETVGDKNQYSRQLFTYGYGKLAITDRKIGETDINNFKEIEIEDRLNADLKEGVKLYANDVYQESLNIKVTKKAGYITVTTQKDCDEAEIDVTFQGLVHLINQGDYVGARLSRTVEFDIEYAPVDSENWSRSTAGMTVENSQNLTVDLSNTFRKVGLSRYLKKTTFVILNIETGIVYSKVTETRVSNKTIGAVTWPTLNINEIVLGYVDAITHKFVNQRSSNSTLYIRPEDFTVNASGSNITVNPGVISGVNAGLTVTAATTQILRKTKRFIFPQRGQYKIRILRKTNDTDTESTLYTIIDDSYLTAIRSITYTNPVNFSDISGSAIRIKSTDQLNGSVDLYNVIATSLVKSYNALTDTWDEDSPSSNPADLFRYVLQSPAFAKRLEDDKIDLEKLKEWSVYCDSLNLEYNRIIDYDTSIDDVLNDICAAGMATLSKVNNIYSVIIDNERPYVTGLVTPRNSWDYSGNILYPEIPHALRVEFRNSEKGYEIDERIVYAEGYDEKTASLFERLEFSSCTNADLAYWYGKRYFATALLQPETHTFKMDFENMTFNRGDRINLVNDVILVGVGQGRIKTFVYDENNNVTGFIIDDLLNIPPVEKLGVRIRDNSGKGIKYHLLKKTESETSEFEFDTALSENEVPAIGSLCAFVEDGKELDLIITKIVPNSNQSATITAINYAPERFNPIGDIPPFESNITIPSSFYKPYPPELAGAILTDESVMIRNSDGSLISVIVIPLFNKNENNVVSIVQIKKRGETEWYIPTAVKKDATELVLTGLYDGEIYDIEIRYQRQTGLQLLSDPLLLNDIKFIGGSTPPKKVQNFRVTVTNGLALFEWAPNNDIDISHYVIRYTSNKENPTWEGSQIVMDKITSTSITNIIHKGVYLIKAVDMLGNESEEATVIFSNDTGAFKNVVEELIQEPSWLGVKDNVIVQKGILALDVDDPDLTDGYYYFDPDMIDLGEIYEVCLTANVQAIVDKRDKVRDMDFIREIVSIREYGNVKPDNSDWSVTLEMNLSNDGINWSGWQIFMANQMKFRACKFRLHLYCASQYINVRVSTCQVVVDMPDRYETGEDIVITDADIGAVVNYSNPFWNNPSVNITLQDAAADDKTEFVTKNKNGFTFKVYNVTLGAYVTRSFDYLAAGYGKVVDDTN